MYFNKCYILNEICVLIDGAF